MATKLYSIRDRARKILLEESNGQTNLFWTDAELFEHLVAGIKDLWGAIVDLHQEHFLKIDDTHVSQENGSATLTGVPDDVFRVLQITPRDTTTNGSNRAVVYMPKKYNSIEFTNARTLDARDPSLGMVVYYDIVNAGAPVSAPEIRVAPLSTNQVLLLLVYIPTPGTIDDADSTYNPIPGEADNALWAWTVAWARAKERDDRSPDPNWLATYATEKQNLLTRLTPRQEQEPEVVPSMFEEYSQW